MRQLNRKSLPANYANRFSYTFQVKLILNDLYFRGGYAFKWFAEGSKIVVYVISAVGGTLQRQVSLKQHNMNFLVDLNKFCLLVVLNTFLQ